MDNIMRLLLVSACAVGGGSEPLGRLMQRRRDAFEVYAREFTRDYEPYMFAAIPLHAPMPVLRVLSRAPLQPSPRAPRPARATLDAQPAPSAHHLAYLPAHPYPYTQPERHYAEPATHYADPSRQTRPRPYAATEPEYEAASYEYEREYPRQTYYQKPRRQVATAAAYEYAAPYDSYASRPPLTYALAPYDALAYSASQEAAPTVLYARPSPSGGFTYRRVPTAAAAGTLAPRKAPAPLKEKEKDPPFIVKIHKYRIVKDDLI